MSSDRTRGIAFGAHDAELHRDLRSRFGEGTSVATLQGILKGGPPDHPHSPFVAAELRSHFRDIALPPAPIPPELFYSELLERIVPHSAPVTSPRCLAHMTSAVPEVLLPAAELIVLLNQNMAKQEASRVFTLLERQVIGTLHNLVYSGADRFYRECVQDDSHTLGIMTSGGTMSNIAALWIARNLALPPREAFAGVEREGLASALRHYGFSRAVVMGSELLHYSIDKAAAVLGLGSDGCIKLPVDRDRRLDLGSLRQALEQSRSRNEIVIAVIGVAGTTDCGTIDPLPGIAGLARAFDTRFHVDAAWGGTLLFSPEHGPKLAGIEQADSVTFDTHKHMHLPVASGVLLLRDSRAAAVIEKRARYMLQERSGDLGARSLEGSRPCSALLVHAALHLIGLQGYRRIVDDSIRRARFMASAIERHPEFELLAAPATNIVLYRYVPARLRDAARRGGLSAEQNAEISALNCAIQQRQAQGNDAAVSRTVIDYPDGHSKTSIAALRAILSHPGTTEDDVMFVLRDQVRLARELDRHT